MVAGRPVTASNRWTIFRMWCRRHTIGLMRPPLQLLAPLRSQLPPTTCRIRRILTWLGFPLLTMSPTLPLSPPPSMPLPASPPTCRIDPPSHVHLCQQRLQPHSLIRHVRRSTTLQPTSCPLLRKRLPAQMPTVPTMPPTLPLSSPPIPPNWPTCMLSSLSSAIRWRRARRNSSRMQRAWLSGVRSW